MPATEFPTPEIPKILTKNNWDKKKGVIAKMHGRTGIGEQMVAFVTAFGKVDWDALNLFKLRMDWKTVTVAEWEKRTKAAKDEMNGSLDKVCDELRDLADLARKVQVDFKKSKTIPSGDAKHVGNIADEADAFADSLEADTVEDIIDKMHDEFYEHIQTMLLDDFVKGLKLGVKKHENTLATARNTPTQTTLENACGNEMCRDLTTGLGNIAKAHDKGFNMKNGAAAQTLYDKLAPYANMEVQATDREEVLKHIDKIAKYFEAVKKFAAGL